MLKPRKPKTWADVSDETMRWAHDYWQEYFPAEPYPLDMAARLMGMGIILEKGQIKDE